MTKTAVPTPSVMLNNQSLLMPFGGSGIGQERVEPVHQEAGETRDDADQDRSDPTGVVNHGLRRAVAAIALRQFMRHTSHDSCKQPKRIKARTMIMVRAASCSNSRYG